MAKPRGKPIKTRKSASKGTTSKMTTAGATQFLLVPSLPPLDEGERQAFDQAFIAFLAKTEIANRADLLSKGREALIIWGLKRKDEMRVLALEEQLKSKKKFSAGERGHIEKTLRREALRQPMNYSEIMDSLLRIADFSEKLRLELEIVRPTIGMSILTNLLYPDDLDHIQKLPKEQRLRASMEVMVERQINNLPGRLACSARTATQIMRMIPVKDRPLGRPAKHHYHTRLVGALADVFRAAGHNPTVIRGAREGEELSPYCESLLAMWKEFPQHLKCDFNTLLIHAEKVLLPVKPERSRKS